MHPESLPASVYNTPPSIAVFVLLIIQLQSRTSPTFFSTTPANMPSFTLKSVLLFAAAVVAVNPPVGTQYNGWETYYNTYDTYGSCGEIGASSSCRSSPSPAPSN